jgi:hypothetical protein
MSYQNNLQDTLAAAIMRGQEVIDVTYLGRQVQVQLPEPQRAGTEWQKRTYALYAAQRLIEVIRVKKEATSITYLDTFSIC